MGWLETHLETFVKPQLDAQENPTGWMTEHKLNEPPTNSCDYSTLTPTDLTVIKNIWRSAKRAADGEKILLLGRDTWIFEILARREEYNTVFDPTVSRQTCYHKSFKKYADADFGLFLDTGFLGSIAKGLGISLERVLLVSSAYNEKSTFLPKNLIPQVFPHLTGSRSLALRIEETPKYWGSASLILENNGSIGITQSLSSQEVFLRAARFTIAIYKNSSPRWITQPKPMGSEFRI